MSTAPAARSPRGVLIAVVAVVGLSLPVAGQSAAIHVNGGALHVKVPSFHFIKGVLLDRLRDGRSARVVLSVTLFARPGVERLAERQGHFVLSYDLWEERFAVTDPGPPSRSISHLTAAGAETWCLDRLTISTSGISRAPGAPLWLRLESIAAREGDEDPAGDAGFSLQGLIDRLSRRTTGVLRESMELGPVQISN